MCHQILIGDLVCIVSRLLQLWPSQVHQSIPKLLTVTMQHLSGMLEGHLFLSCELGAPEFQPTIYPLIWWYWHWGYQPPVVLDVVGITEKYLKEERLWAHLTADWCSLLSKFMVITWRRSDSGNVLSHMIHVWPSWLVRCFACPPSVLPPQEWRFLARSSFVLLNAKRQFVRYFAPFPLSLASIRPPSSSLAGSTANGSSLISLNRGILVASEAYPSCPGTF